MSNEEKNIDNVVEPEVKKPRGRRKKADGTVTDKPSTKATKKVQEPVQEQEQEKPKRNKRVRRSDLPVRPVIREKIREWERTEVRSAQARINAKTKAMNFRIDPRNADLLDKFTASNGLMKTLTIDLAIFRLIEEVENGASQFPYEAMAHVDVQNEETTSFKISEVTKNRLNNFCNSKGLKVQMALNIALQAFFDENRNIID